MKKNFCAIELGRLSSALAITAMSLLPTLSHAQSVATQNAAAKASADTTANSATDSAAKSVATGGTADTATNTTASVDKTQAKADRVATHTKTANSVATKAEQTGDTHGDAATPTAADTTAALTKPANTGNDVDSLVDMLTKGHFSGDFRSLYFSTRNSFFTAGVNQNTVSYGGKLAYTTARFYGFSMGVSAFVQRGIAHSSDPDRVDSYLGPNITAMGEAYVKWEHEWEHNKFAVTVGNQELDAPFASTYDWRMAPELYQGIDARYGDADNYITAFKMFRYKSYIDDSFTQRTNYNSSFDSYSSIGNQETNGFWGVGIGHKFVLNPVVLTGQAWYQSYEDYADLGYLEGQISKAEGSYKPFLGAQYFHETGDGRELLGHVDSQVYGLQLGVKHNSITLALGYDYIVPHQNSYLNGALVTPYAHNVASGPLFAQPFLTSTQDLGAGSAYAIDINGAATANLFIGARYSFMDLKEVAGGPSLNQSEYLAYAIYNFQGKLKGLSLSDFLGVQTSPVYGHTFLQNRVQVEYAWGGK